MPISDYTPSVQQVAFMVKSYTKNRWTNEVGTFDDSTNPTGTEVVGMIAEAADEVALAVGPDLPDYVIASSPDADVAFLRKSGKSLVTLLAAMNVVNSVTPEQVNDPRSAYSALERRYNQLRKVFMEAVEEARGDAGGGDGGGESVATSHTALPLGSFPAEPFPVDIADADCYPRF